MAVIINAAVRTQDEEVMSRLYRNILIVPLSIFNHCLYIHNYSVNCSAKDALETLLLRTICCGHISQNKLIWCIERFPNANVSSKEVSFQLTFPCKLSIHPKYETLVTSQYLDASRHIWKEIQSIYIHFTCKFLFPFYAVNRIAGIWLMGQLYCSYNVNQKISWQIMFKSSYIIAQL